jgi:hypothetical protein
VLAISEQQDQPEFHIRAQALGDFAYYSHPHAAWWHLSVAGVRETVDTSTEASSWFRRSGTDTSYTKLGHRISTDTGSSSNTMVPPSAWFFSRILWRNLPCYDACTAKFTRMTYLKPGPHILSTQPSTKKLSKRSIFPYDHFSESDSPQIWQLVDFGQL